MTKSKGVLAFRFDIESAQCLRVGVPRLRRLAERRGVRFTFFATMGRAADIGLEFRRRWSSACRALTRRPPAVEQEPHLGVARKLGLRSLLETIVLNPRLGSKYRAEIDAIVADGHELGLHGGINHAVWQHELHRLDAGQVDALFRPAFDEFASRYGVPKGFSAPGFQSNEHVLEILDREGFLYAGDMIGEHPMRPENGCGGRHLCWQVPVNVVGRGSRRVPVVEQELARGRDAAGIVEQAVAQIRKRDFALMYEHPYVAGVHDDVLDKIIERVEGDYEIVTVEEYLAEWGRRHE